MTVRVETKQKICQEKFSDIRLDRTYFNFVPVRILSTRLAVSIPMYVQGSYSFVSLGRVGNTYARFSPHLTNAVYRSIWSISIRRTFSYWMEVWERERTSLLVGKLECHRVWFYIAQGFAWWHSCTWLPGDQRKNPTSWTAQFGQNVYTRASTINQNFLLPTDAQENCFQRSIKIYIKITASSGSVRSLMML